MKQERKVKFFTVAALMVVGMLTFCVSTAAGGFFFGRVAKPGTELYELGSTALKTNGGEMTYFTNGHGRILRVQSGVDGEGTLRVSVDRTYIPNGYIAGTQLSTNTIGSLYNKLSTWAKKSEVKAGGYAMLSSELGAKAFECGCAIAASLDSE